MAETCLAEGCGKKTGGSIYCPMHRRRLKVHGSLDLPKREFQKDMACSFEGCNNMAAAKGLCSTHRLREKLYGDASVTHKPNLGKVRPFLDSLIEEGQKWPDECIVWPFSRDDKGYAQINTNGRPHKASEIICERVYGPKPQDGKRWKAFYECKNGGAGCVNPKHLNWGTQAAVEHVKMEYGVGNQGEGNGQHKLLETDIPEIRWATLTMSDSEIGRNYGVGRKAISRIRRGIGWKHVG